MKIQLAWNDSLCRTKCEQLLCCVYMTLRQKLYTLLAVSDNDVFMAGEAVASCDVLALATRLQFVNYLSDSSP